MHVLPNTTFRLFKEGHLLRNSFAIFVLTTLLTNVFIARRKTGETAPAQCAMMKKLSDKFAISGEMATNLFYRFVVCHYEVKL